MAKVGIFCSVSALAYTVDRPVYPDNPCHHPGTWDPNLVLEILLLTAPKKANIHQDIEST